MLSNFLRFLSAVVLSTGLVNTASAVTFEEDTYEVYLGDFNGDGLDQDIYFHGKDVFVLIHGSVSIPIFAPGPMGFVFYQNSESDATPLDIPSEQLSAYTLIQEGSDYAYGDFNSDGSLDVIVYGTGGGATTLLGGNAASSLTGQQWAQSLAVEAPNHTPSTFSPAQHDATVGSLEGSGSVAGGQAAYNIPIIIPPGRASMEPSIGITYSSQAGNSELGMGFSLSATSAISRCGQTVDLDGRNLSVQYHATDDRLCFNGQRMMAISGVYGQSGTIYRTELDQFVRITQIGGINSLTTRFIVEYKGGTIAYYGESSDSRVIPEGAPAVLSWLIKREQDRTVNANSIRYHYTNFGRGEVNLSNIYYTGSGNTDGDRRVEFVYQTRSDISSSYLAGGVTAQTQRLHRIRTYYQSTSVREYNFSYRLSDASQRSLIQSIQVCGFDNFASRVCSPATDMEWYDDAPKFVLEPVGYREAGTFDPHLEGGTIVPQLQNIDQIEQVIPQRDVNGDGTADWPTWFSNAEGVYKGENTSPGISCRRTGVHIFHCANGDINRDGKSDSWRINNQTKRLELSYSSDSNNPNWFDSTIDLSHANTISDGVYSLTDYNADSWPDLIVSTGELVNDQPYQLTLYMHSGNPDAPYNGNDGILLFEYNLEFIKPCNPCRLEYSNNVQLVGDLNGDSLPDMIVFTNSGIGRTSSAREIIFTRLDAEGRPYFTDKLDIRPHRTSLPPSTDLGADLRPFDYFMDVNGDGLIDWLAWNDTRQLWLSVNRGDGSFGTWQNLGPQGRLLSRIIPITFNAEPLNTYTPKFGHALRQFDYDADGRPELLVPDERLMSVCLNRVTRFISNSSESIRLDTRDLCGDQVYNSYAVRLSGGTSVQRSVDLATFDSNVYRYKAFYFIEDANGTFHVESRPTPLIGAANQALGTDAFGNGLSDFVFHLGCLSTDFCDEQTQLGEIADLPLGVYVNRNRGSATGNERYEPMDMLKSTTNALGYSEQWHYRPLASEDPRYHSSAKPYYTPDFGYLNTLQAVKRDEYFHFSSSMYTVAEYKNSDGIGGENSTQWRYKGAVYNSVGRGFQGFRTVIAEDLTNGLHSHTDFHQIYPIAGQVERQRQYALTDVTSDAALDNINAISESLTSWQFWPLNGKGGAFNEVINVSTDYWDVTKNTPYFVGIAKQTEISRTLGGRQETHRTTSTSFFDVWGNLTVQNSSYTEPTNRHNVRTQVVTQYEPDSASWFLGRMQEQTTTRFAIVDRNGVAITNTNPLDNQHSITTNYLAWDVNARQPTDVLSTPSSGIATRVRATYNDYGLPESVMNSSLGETSRFASTSYSNDGYFVRSTVNTLGHAILTETDPRFGVPLWIQDPNGNRSAISYDLFGRPVTNTVSGIAPPTYISMAWCNNCGVENALYTLTVEQEGAPRQTAYIDQLGRTIQTEAEALDTNNIIVQASKYNTRGLMTFSSAPNFNSVSSYGMRYNEYDILGRVTEKASDNTDGQVLLTTYTYDQGGNGFTTLINASGLHLSRTYNGLQQLIETVDAIGGTTRYAYDGSGNVILAEDANGHSIRARYNALNQKEWVRDPNMGLKTFFYTGFGEVLNEVDGNGVSTMYTYDSLGRMVTRSVNAIPEARWIYDTAENGIGLLASEEKLGLSGGESFGKQYFYDEFSRPLRVATTIDGEVFNVSQQYDDYYGRPKGMQYPNGLTVAYSYNERGYQTRVSNAANGFVYREISATDAYGQWQAAQLGNGTSSVLRQYHEETGQISGLEIHNALGLLHKQDYQRYDVYGNLTETTINIPSASPSQITEAYIYDDLHRLTRNERTGVAAIDYQYDAVGNLRAKSDYANNYEYTGIRPNAVSRVDLVGGGSLSFGYDGNGNRTHENGVETLRYNFINKPTRITRLNTHIEFSYGADLSRYKQVNVNQDKTTLYIDKVFEKITEGSRTQLRLFIADIAVLTVEQENGVTTDESIGFTHRDRLGSAVAITDQLGILRETHSFDPFGKPRQGQGLDKNHPIVASQITTRGFTDHEHLDDVRLIHMNGRVYDYNIGRFLSVDPLTQGVGSQGLNPYSYIMNNPLAGTDPSGYTASRLHQEIDDKGQIWVLDEGGDGMVVGNSNNPEGGTTSNGSNEGSSGVASGPGTAGSATTSSSNEIGKLASRPKAANSASSITSNLQLKLNSGSSSSLAREASQLAASFVPFGESILLAAQGQFRDAAISAATEGAFALAGALTGGLAYAGYKAFRQARLVARARNAVKLRGMRLPDHLNGAGSDLSIVNLQPDNLGAKLSAQALARVRGDKIIDLGELSALKKGDTLTLVGHGTPVRAGGLLVEELADLLSQKNLSAGVIELVSCKTGCSIFAQRLANLTQARVLAPKGNVNILVGDFGVVQVRDPITGKLRNPGELIETFEPLKP